MANRKTYAGRRLWVSAWLSPGLALGWLAVLSAFVHGTGVLLAAWAATTALVVLAVLTFLVLRRHTTVPTAHPQTAARPSSTPSGKDDPARSQDGAEQAATSAARGVAAVPEARSPGEPVAQVRSPSSVPAATAPAADAPVVEPTVADLAMTLGLQVLTATEVASVLRVDADLVVTAISKGEFPGNRIGGHWRVDLSALRRWLQGTYSATASIPASPAPAVFGDDQG